MIRIRNQIHSKKFAAVSALLAVVALSSCTTFKRWAYARGDRDAWQNPGSQEHDGGPRSMLRGLFSLGALGRPGHAGAERHAHPSRRGHHDRTSCAQGVYS